MKKKNLKLMKEFLHYALLSLAVTLWFWVGIASRVLIFAIDALEPLPYFSPLFNPLVGIAVIFAWFSIAIVAADKLIHSMLKI